MKEALLPAEQVPHVLYRGGDVPQSLFLVLLYQIITKYVIITGHYGYRGGQK